MCNYGISKKLIFLLGNNLKSKSNLYINRRRQGNIKAFFEYEIMQKKKKKKNEQH